MISDAEIKVAMQFWCPIKCDTPETIKHVLVRLREMGCHWANGNPLDENDNWTKWSIKSLEDGCNPIYITPKKNHLVCWGTTPDSPNGFYL